MLGTYGQKKQLLPLRGPARPAERAQVFWNGQSKGLDTDKGEDQEPGSRQAATEFQMWEKRDCFRCTVGDEWRRERKRSRLVRRLLANWERNHLEGEFNGFKIQRI